MGYYCIVGYVFYKQTKKVVKDINMKEFLKSLLSRKFLLALGTVIVLIASEQYMEAVAVVLGYLGINVANKAVNAKIAVTQE